MPGVVHCRKCGKDVAKGTYCDVCERYVGVEGVSYCEKSKRPRATGASCGGCPNK